MNSYRQCPWGFMQGPLFVLNPARPNLVVTKAEAMQWAAVNPFSPLCDGSLINPF